ncbi:MAG: hypothetical protein OEX98_08060 [Nitrosopumilus sp.]|nr:hypothetical protein [Nitrosopumilus sp.]
MPGTYPDKEFLQTNKRLVTLLKLINADGIVNVVKRKDLESADFGILSLLLDFENKFANSLEAKEILKSLKPEIYTSKKINVIGTKLKERNQENKKD